MTQRTQWIILAVLLCIMAVIALTSITHKSPAAGPASPALNTGAPAGEAVAAAKPEGDALNPAQFEPLREWFNAKGKPSDMSQETANAIGMPQKSGQTSGGSQTDSATPAAPGVLVATRQIEPPPALQGTLWVNGTGMALFEGDAFRSGEIIRGTAYTITAVKAQSVSVKGADGQVITLKLSD